MDVSKTIPNVDSTTIEIDSSENLRVKDSGISTAKLASGAVTPAKVASQNYAISSSCGTFSTAATSSTAVTNLSVTVTPDSGKLWCITLSGTTGASTGAYISATGSFGGYIEIFRGATLLSRFFIDDNEPVQGPVQVFEVPPSGSQTYSVSVYSTSGAATVFVVNYKLIAYQIL